MLAYGSPGDIQEDYARMAESITLECLYKFCRAMVGVFGGQYLRSPNAEDTARILAQNEARGFSRHGKTSAKGACSVVLEAVATHDV